MLERRVNWPKHEPERLDIGGRRGGNGETGSSVCPPGRSGSQRFLAIVARMMRTHAKWPWKIAIVEVNIISLTPGPSRRIASHGRATAMDLESLMLVTVGARDRRRLEALRCSAQPQWQEINAVRGMVVVGVWQHVAGAGQTSASRGA